MIEDILDMAEMLQFFFEKVENMDRTGENPGQNFHSDKLVLEISCLIHI